MPSDSSTVHIRIKDNGNALKRSLFHYILGSLDPDYPYAPHSVIRNGALIHICQQCGGRVWKDPILTKEMLGQIASQVNLFTTIGVSGALKVKIKQWALEREACSNARYLTLEEARSQPEELSMSASDASEGVEE